MQTDHGLMLKARASSAKIAWGGVKVQQKYEKPPIGLRPRIIWLNEREMEITEAIERYQEVGKEVPEVWRMELAWIMAQMALEGNKI